MKRWAVKFKNRAVIVTDSTGGIGREVALAFAHNGAKVVVSGRDEAALGRLVAEIESFGGRAVGFLADATKKNEVDGLVGTALSRFGRVDVLVNHAGATCGSNVLEDVTEEEWDQVIDRSMKSVFLCSQAVVGIMRRQNHGRIINIAIQAGKGAPLSAGPHHAGAKAGLIGFTRRLAKNMARFDVLVRAIALTLIYNGLQSGQLWDLYHEEELNKFLDDIPAGRLVMNRDAAAAVLSLASGKAGCFEDAMETYGYGWGV